MAFKVFAFGSSDGDIQKHWTYDSHQYPYNMTMIGAIQIDGEEQQSEYLEIGAFCGGECRGSELLAYYPAVEKYLVFLTVYGSNDDEITFKLYDHQTEAELDLENQQAVPFSANAFFGNPNEPYLFGFNSDVTWLTITANVMPEGSGYVNGYDSFYGNFTYGSTCTLEASPEWNYQFLYWMKDGVQVSTSATYSFTVTEDANYTAYFVLGSYINPYWTYNSHLYEHSMTMIGIVKIDGEEQRSPYLEIGAFCESECRGSTLMQYIPTLDRYLAFLTVFGNDENIINFRLFDHYNGYEVDRMAPSFSFAADAICGNPGEPFVFNFASNITMTTFMSSGWNWWSSYITMNTEEDFGMLKTALGSNASLIKSKADGFVSYMGDWYGTLLAINNKEMYMIDMNSDQTVEISGLPADLASNPITIWNGWNWIGFPSDVSVDLNSALANMTPEDSDLIKSRNAYATYYSSMGSWFGTLTELTPGMGYMYKSNNEDPFEFVYSTSSRGGQEPPEIQMTNHWDVSVGEYSDNATLIGVIAINGEEQRNDNLVVGAFVGDRCVGETNVMYIEPLDRYFVFLNYFGNENDAITFRLYDGDSGIETIGEETTIVFNPNSVIGAMDDPYIINFGTLGMDEFAKEIKLFPNPVEANGKVNVSLKVDGVTSMRVEIVNTLGVAVCQDTYHTNAADIKAPRVPGIYIVKMTGDNGLVYYGKLIVE